MNAPDTDRSNNYTAIDNVPLVAPFTRWYSYLRLIKILANIKLVILRFD